jgi:hypothetical protein
VKYCAHESGTERLRLLNLPLIEYTGCREMLEIIKIVTEKYNPTVAFVLECGAGRNIGRRF